MEVCGARDWKHPDSHLPAFPVMLLALGIEHKKRSSLEAALGESTRFWTYMWKFMPGFPGGGGLFFPPAHPSSKLLSTEGSVEPLLVRVIRTPVGLGLI